MAGGLLSLAVSSVRAARRGRLRVALVAVLAALSVLLVALPMPDPVAAAGPAEVVRRGPNGAKVVALTIDDGWHPGRCGQMFDILVESGVPATWFPNAVYMDRAAGLWRRIAKRHPIANHTTHHRSLPTLSESRMRHEIMSSERRIERMTGRPMSKVLRPPYGAYDRRVLRVAGDLGYDSVALWDISAADTSREATVRSVAKSASRGGPGSVILMHCGPEATPKALPIIIARYACAGFRFTTFEGLLAGDRGVVATVPCPPPALPGGGARQAADRPARQRPLAGTRAELEGREWRLVEARADDGLEPVGADVALSVRFGPRTASGVAGCDPFSAPVRHQRDGRLSFGRVVRGTEGCPDAAGDGTERVLDMLVAGGPYRVADGTLDILDPEGRERLRFEASGPVSYLGEWRVSALADDSGTLGEPASERPLTAAFSPTGQLRGSTGCNTYVGGYTSRGEALMVGPLLTGPATCSEAAAALESRFLEVWHSVQEWRLREATLELRDATTGIVLELVPAEPSP
jgi:peptidoglycan/xylan/chitin deacetylase (PgdA/CDA1 family)/heat shock protein HslJ